MDRSELGIVIPAYNEAATIANVIVGIEGLGIPIVINDNSTDDTGSIAIDAGATVVSHQTNLGYDKAINTGFKQADRLGCKYVITMDADGQHEPTSLIDFIAQLQRGAELVLGVRDCQQRSSELVFSWITRMLFGIHDPLCGMKGYKMDVYRKLGHFDSYQSIGTELAIFGVRSGYQFKEVTVLTRSRVDDPRFGKFMKANYLIFRAMFMAFFMIHPIQLNNR